MEKMWQILDYLKKQNHQDDVYLTVFKLTKERFIESILNEASWFIRNVFHFLYFRQYFGTLYFSLNNVWTRLTNNKLFNLLAKILKEFLYGKKMLFDIPGTFYKDLRNFCWKFLGEFWNFDLCVAEDKQIQC